MRDDYERLWQQILHLRAQVIAGGLTPARLICLANLSLVIGHPDHAHEYMTVAAKHFRGDPNVAREILWIDALAYCLEAAIAEGKAVGAPNVKVKVEKALEYRESAKVLLQRLAVLPEPAAEEVTLLRKLVLGRSMDSVASFIDGRGGRV